MFIIFGSGGRKLQWIQCVKTKVSAPELPLEAPGENPFPYQPCVSTIPPPPDRPPAAPFLGMWLPPGYRSPLLLSLHLSVMCLFQFQGLCAHTGPPWVNQGISGLKILGLITWAHVYTMWGDMVSGSRD